MKLYNLYEQVILESIGNDINDIISGHVASNGRKYWNPVEIIYRSEKSGKVSSTRQIMIYGRGTLKSKDGNGNDAIRVFQAFGDTQTVNSSWKTLLVNNISKIVEVKDFKFYMEPSDVSGGGGIPDYVGPKDRSFKNDMLTHYIKF